MKSAPDASATELARRVSPPSAPLAMPDQIIERKRSGFSLLSLLSLSFFTVKP